MTILTVTTSVTTTINYYIYLHCYIGLIYIVKI